MDDDAPLCEDCGYDLAGLAQDHVCPECGRAVAASYPASRPGSAWQRAPGLFAWLRTLWRVLRHPNAAFSEVRIAAGEHGLLIVNMLLAGAAIVAPWWGVFVGDPARGTQRVDTLATAARLTLVGVVQVGVAAAVLYLLTSIEYLGIRFITRRRGWRLTRAGAMQVCAHASFGWLFCGGLAMLFLAGMFSVLRLFGVAPGGTLDLAPALPVRVDWSQIVGVGGPVLAYALGLLIFETLVYRGVRACKYAATLRPSARTG